MCVCIQHSSNAYQYRFNKSHRRTLCTYLKQPILKYSLYIIPPFITTISIVHDQQHQQLSSSSCRSSTFTTRRLQAGNYCVPRSCLVSDPTDGSAVRNAGGGGEPEIVVRERKERKNRTYKERKKRRKKDEKTRRANV